MGTSSVNGHLHLNRKITEIDEGILILGVDNHPHSLDIHIYRIVLLTVRCICFIGFTHARVTSSKILMHLMEELKECILKINN